MNTRTVLSALIVIIAAHAVAQEPSERSVRAAVRIRQFENDVRNIVNDSNLKIQSLEKKLVNDLSRSFNDATKAGQLDEALLIRKEIMRTSSGVYRVKSTGLASDQLDLQLENNDTQAPGHSDGRVVFDKQQSGERSKWDLPYGGRFSSEDDVVTLAGPGDISASGAIAIFDSAISDKYLISGELYRSGDYVGFVLGYSPQTKRFVSFYSIRDKESDMWLHNEKSRSKVSLYSLPWPRDVWVSFNIKRNRGIVKVEIGNDDIEISLPEAANGNYFGLISHYDASIKIRNVVIKIPQ